MNEELFPASEFCCVIQELVSDGKLLHVRFHGHRAQVDLPGTVLSF